MSTERDEDKLLPCPFCGGEPILEDHRLLWIVRCVCTACVLGEAAPEPVGEFPREYWERFKRTAAERWNRRSTATTSSGEREG